MAMQPAFEDYNKQAILKLAKKLLSDLLQHRSAEGDQIALPWRRYMNRPYPSARWGGERELAIETYARSAFLAACILANEPHCALAGLNLREFYINWLLKIVRDPEFLPLRHRYDQATAEGALICISLEEGSLLSSTTPTQKEEILSWLAHYRDCRVMHNNWLWFHIVMDAFLDRHGKGSQTERRSSSLALIDGMYAGDGWYRDGDKGCFDYYATWSFQFYPLFLMRWDALDAATATTLKRHNDLFLNSFSHLFSRGGHMPCWGRSITYRFAASAAFSVAFTRPDVQFSGGFARHICAGNLAQFLSRPWRSEGIPTLGFYAADASLIDPYSCMASPLWCFKHFVCLLLDERNAFWEAPESSGWWGRTERYEIAGTGMYVTHDECNSTLFARQNRGKDPLYTQAFYRTDEAA